MIIKPYNIKDFFFGGMIHLQKGLLPTLLFIFIFLILRFEDFWQDVRSRSKNGEVAIHNTTWFLGDLKSFTRSLNSFAANHNFLHSLHIS